MTELAGPAEALFEEHLGAQRRDWRWLPVVVVVTFVVVAPVIAPLAAAAWLVNVARYRRARVRVDHEYLWVRKRSVRLCALELSTLGQAGNTWPWRPLNRRYLGANPIWTRDSVSLRGIDGGKKYWVAVGTNHRDALVDALVHAAPAARARAETAGTWSPTTARMPAAAWHPDPWDPTGQRRWWDGTQWTGWTAPNASSGLPPGVGPPPPSDPERP
jgi:hypothetical protein